MNCRDCCVISLSVIAVPILISVGVIAVVITSPIAAVGALFYAVNTARLGLQKLYFEFKTARGEDGAARCAFGLKQELDCEQNYTTWIGKGIKDTVPIPGQEYLMRQFGYSHETTYPLQMIPEALMKSNLKEALSIFTTAEDEQWLLAEASRVKYQERYEVSLGRLKTLTIHTIPLVGFVWNIFRYKNLSKTLGGGVGTYRYLSKGAPQQHLPDTWTTQQAILYHTAVARAKQLDPARQ